MPSKQIDLIVAFYSPSIKATFTAAEPDCTLDRILTWSDEVLEARHDYIQHLFPLPEPSPVNPRAAVIDQRVRDAFHYQPELRDNLRCAFKRMCSFYGFDTCGCLVRKAVNFHSRAGQSWLVARDHNHLRITRIVRSMRILGLESVARKFVLALLEADAAAGKVVSETSVMFWCRAAVWPLEKPPSFPRENEVGWLRQIREEEEKSGGGVEMADGERELVEALRKECERRGQPVT